MDITNLFGPIMVIGSVLALIFAAGALWNSFSRRRLLAPAKLVSDKEERIVFKPMPAVTDKHEKMDAPVQGPLPSLFRQIGPTGVVPADSNDVEDDLYVWE